MPFIRNVSAVYKPQHISRRITGAIMFFFWFPAAQRKPSWADETNDHNYFGQAGGKPSLVLILEGVTSLADFSFI